MTISSDLHLEAGDKVLLRHFPFTSGGHQFASLALQISKGTTHVCFTVYSRQGCPAVPAVLDEGTAEYLLSLVSDADLAAEIERRKEG